MKSNNNSLTRKRKTAEARRALNGLQAKNPLDLQSQRSPPFFDRTDNDNFY